MNYEFFQSGQWGTGAASLGECQILPSIFLEQSFLQTQVVFLYTWYQYSPLSWGCWSRGLLLCSSILSNDLFCALQLPLVSPDAWLYFLNFSPQGNLGYPVWSRNFSAISCSNCRLNFISIFPFLVSHVLSANHYSLTLFAYGCFFVAW